MIEPTAAAETTFAVTLRQDDADLVRAAALSGPRVHPPARLAGYDIQRCLGDGAYGSVWLATAQNTGKQVAIKFYSHRPGLDWSLLNREVEKLAVLYTCRDIIGLIEVGWDADPPYYVMEYLENGSLANLLEKGPLPPAEALRIVTGVTHALVHAHQSGVLHCDVKPANILLDSSYSPRLADFGQSRLSHEQNPALGTLYYMAPEQADLEAIPDARWDVYALGALFYQALTGEIPYRSVEHEQLIDAASSLEERLAIYRQFITDSPRPQLHRHVKGVDNFLADIIDRCLEVNPAKRYADALAVQSALEKRARYRARRPLIVVGIAGPILLLCTMIPIVMQAMKTAVRTAEINLAARAIESDVVTAKILALSVENGLDRRTHDLSHVAADPDLRTLLIAAEGQPPSSMARQSLDAWLTDQKASTDEILHAHRMVRDDSWLLLDAKGYQRWRSPTIEAMLDKNFAYRDYFHGQGRDFDPLHPPAKIEPLRSPYLSKAFRSRADGQLAVGISVPIWNQAHDKVLGVLARTVHVGQLLTDYKVMVHGATRTDVDRIIALVDTRTWQLLDHPWMTPEMLATLSDSAVLKLTLEPRQRAELRRVMELTERNENVGDEARDVRYIDPIAKVGDEARKTYGMEWLAAFWPVGKTGWMAVVQERRDDALQPVREIHNGMVKYAIGGFCICCTLIGTLWYFVVRAMGNPKPRMFKPKPDPQGA